MLRKYFSVVITRGKGRGEGRRGYKGINGDGRRLNLGWWAHIQHTDDVL